MLESDPSWKLAACTDEGAAVALAIIVVDVSDWLRSDVAAALEFGEGDEGPVCSEDCAEALVGSRGKICSFGGVVVGRGLKDAALLSSVDCAVGEGLVAEGDEDAAANTARFVGREDGAAVAAVSPSEISWRGRRWSKW